DGIRDATVTGVQTCALPIFGQGAEPSKVVVAGDSAGGGLAVSTMIAVRDRGLPRCAGIVALSPWADLTCNGDSMTSRATTDLERSEERRVGRDCQNYYEALE